MILRDEIRQALADLELISHAPIPAYGARTQPGSDEEIGGKRPPGSDREFRPRRPSKPLIEGDPASEKAWGEYDEELAAWQTCYQRRTVAYYRALPWTEGTLDDIRRTIRAWRVMQIPAGQPPAPGDPLWKRYIAESREDPGTLATRFNMTRRYINKIRQQYRQAA